VQGICQGNGEALLISIYSPTSATSNFPLYPSFFFLLEKAFQRFCKETVQIHRQQMYIRVHLLTASFCCAKTSLLHGATAIRGGSEMYVHVSF